ncbi:MAG TPA: toxin-antitoxin system HicB family antitoxin [Legionellales bacterium]|nr:toxin-antitoxin system HicB family antitoxin [Legionellales bacterium]
MNTMNYKNYTARIEYSDEDDCFIGHIAGINDLVGFHANAVSELHTAFEEAVDDYIQTCKKTGRSPQKPYSGKIMLRVPPEIHARAAMMAEAHGKSLNSWVTELLANVSGPW